MRQTRVSNHQYTKYIDTLLIQYRKKMDINVDKEEFMQALQLYKINLSQQPTEVAAAAAAEEDSNKKIESLFDLRINYCWSWIKHFEQHLQLLLQIRDNYRLNNRRKEVSTTRLWNNTTTMMDTGVCEPNDNRMMAESSNVSTTTTMDSVSSNRDSNNLNTCEKNSRKKEVYKNMSPHLSLSHVKRYIHFPLSHNETLSYEKFEDITRVWLNENLVHATKSDKFYFTTISSIRKVIVHGNKKRLKRLTKKIEPMLRKLLADRQFNVSNRLKIHYPNRVYQPRNVITNCHFLV